MDWSNRAQENLYHFYEDFNDYNFYIEDKASATQKIFRNLLNRMYGNLNISRVFSLDGRGNVVKKSIKCQNRKNIYVIDGDLYSVLNEKQAVVLNTNLVVLERYCLENYLIDEDSILDAVDTIEFINDRDEIKRIINFNNWLISNAILKDLFIVFALVHKYCTGVATVSKKVPYYTDSKSCNDVVCRTKVQSEIENYLQLLNENLGDELGTKLFDYWKESISSSGKSLVDICSGKDFLFILLLHRIKMSSSVMCSLPKSSLYLLISKFSPIAPLKKILDPVVLNCTSRDLR